MIKEVNGNLLTYPGISVIAHQTNCLGVMGGGIAKQIGDRFGIDNRKCASILDTMSCCVQGVIPYGAQVLMAAGLAGVNPVGIIPYLYYPYLLGIVTILAIIIRYPRRYS